MKKTYLNILFILAINTLYSQVRTQPIIFKAEGMIEYKGGRQTLDTTGFTILQLNLLSNGQPDNILIEKKLDRSIYQITDIQIGTTDNGFFYEKIICHDDIFTYLRVEEASPIERIIHTKNNVSRIYLKSNAETELLRF